METVYTTSQQDGKRGVIVRAYIHPGKNNPKNCGQRLQGKVDSPEDAVFADIDNDGAIDVIQFL